MKKAIICLLFLMASCTKAFDSWIVLPICSEAEFNQGSTGGEAEQHIHGMCRSVSNPDILYISQDVAGPWKSTNAGDSWQKCEGRGLYLKYGQSIECDPVNPNIVFIQVDTVWFAATNESYEGLYKSTDGGKNWTQVLSTTYNYNTSDEEEYRVYKHNIAYDLASITGSTATRWYAAFHKNGLYKSTDSGDSWSRIHDWSSDANFTNLYQIQCHPTDGNTVYVGCTGGLYKWDGSSLSKIGTGLPAKAVTSIQVHPATTSTIFVCSYKDGLYKSTDSGDSFSEIYDEDAWGIFINQGDPNYMYFTMYTRTFPNEGTFITHDGGSTWVISQEALEVTPFPGLGRDDYAKSIKDDNVCICPNPSDVNEAVAFSESHIYKTTDGGYNFNESSYGYTGFAVGLPSGFAFHPTDTNTVALFIEDKSCVITHNGGSWFEQVVNVNDSNLTIAGWKAAGDILHTSCFAGAYKPGTTETLSACVGKVPTWTNRTEMIYLADEDTGWVRCDDINDRIQNVFYHPQDGNVCYAASRKSTDGGQSWVDIDFGDFNSLNPEVFGMALSQPNTVYALDGINYTRIYKSTDAGANWSLYSQPGWNFHTFDGIATFAVSPSDANVIYTLDTNDDLAKFDGTNWTSFNILSLTDAPNDLTVHMRSVCIDPGDGDNIYCCLATAGISCVFRSTDGGSNWKDITYNLPRIGYRSISVNPHTHDLWIGGACGTWKLKFSCTDKQWRLFRRLDGYRQRYRF